MMPYSISGSTSTKEMERYSLCVEVLLAKELLQGIFMHCAMWQLRLVGMQYF
jgi:hypothetical protein